MSWVPPDGQFEGFDLKLSSNSSESLNLYLGPNETNQTINYLLANTSYSAFISVRSSNLSSDSKVVSSTTKIIETVYELDIIDLDRLDFTLLPNQSLIELADLTSEKIQTINTTETKEALDKSSVIIKEIAEKSNNSLVMLRMLQLSDVTFNQSDNYYEEDLELSGRLSRNLEKLAAKIDVHNFTNNFYEFKYTNFYLKTKAIQKNFSLSDLAFNTSNRF